MRTRPSNVMQTQQTNYQVCFDAVYCTNLHSYFQAKQKTLVVPIVNSKIHCVER